MSNIFFTSDTHFHHSNICRGSSKWQEDGREGSHQQTRDFKTLAEMDEAIIQGINSKVKFDDVLYHLGDWSFGGIEQIWNFRRRINCKTVHLIFGNHDHHIENNRKLPNARMVLANKFLIDREEKDENFEPVKAKELFATTNYVNIVNANGTKLFLSHYAHRIWDKSHHGRIHLYGHSHASLEQKEHGKSMDVGIDNYFRLFGKYEPFSLKQIVDIMAKREAAVIDHHNKSTN